MALMKYMQQYKIIKNVFSHYTYLTSLLKNELRQKNSNWCLCMLLFLLHFLQLSGLWRRWKEISRSECSSHCGKGFQKVAYRCSQEFNNVSISQPLPEGYCSHLQRPNPTDPCYGSCDQFRWQYYDWEPVIFTFVEKFSNLLTYLCSTSMNEDEDLRQ